MKYPVYKKGEKIPFEFCDDILVMDLACCDCGLTHELHFKMKIKNNKIISVKCTGDRLDRSTAQIRRHGNCLLMKNKNKNWKMIRT